MAGKSNGVDSMDWARAPPKKLPLCERILKAIYDPEDKTFLGRTPKRWGIMIIFYLIFYAVLALLFAVCMGCLFMCLYEDKPMYILEKSLIGSNPGVSYRPRPRDGVTVQYSAENSTGYETYVKELRDFTQPYLNKSWYMAKTECNHQDNFGYPDRPCFFLKLNKIYGWKPEFYRIDAVLPADMSYELAEYIKQVPDSELTSDHVLCTDCLTLLQDRVNTTSVGSLSLPAFGHRRVCFSCGRSIVHARRTYPVRQDRQERNVIIRLVPLHLNNQIWVSCFEESTNLTRIEYPWGRGLPGSFYPYLNQRDYTSPFLAIRIIPPSNNAPVTVRCRTWAKNIVYNKSLKEPSGYTRIQLSVDFAGNITEKAVIAGWEMVTQADLLINI